MAEKIKNDTVFSKWAEIINSINDDTVTNAESIANLGTVHTFDQKIDGDDPNKSESFDDALNRFQTANPTVVIKKNDVAVVSLVDVADASIVYEQAAYVHTGTKFEACTGAVDADKVILRSDITLAGDYTAVGNLTKTKTGTATFETKGMSVADALTEILSKRLQPSITTPPSVSAFSLTAPTTTSVEAGTKFTSMSYSAGTFSDGAYTYEDTTGVTVSNWKVERITNLATTEIKSVNGTTLAAGSDDNGGNGFQIGDEGGTFGENNTPVVSSVKYKATATHGAGNLAKDNLGSPCTNSTQIAADSKSKETSSVTCYRNYFYGAVSTTGEIDSDYIRNLTKSGKAYKSKDSFKVTTTNGTKRIIVACLADSGKDFTFNENFALKNDVKSNFASAISVDVEGANGYSAKSYNVWVWEPALAWDQTLEYVGSLK